VADEDKNEPPFRRGQTVRLHYGDDGESKGTFHARVLECKKGYGGLFYAVIKWVSGPAEGETMRIGPQYFEKVDLLTRLGDLAREVEE
jgi:hypothetical protein